MLKQDDPRKCSAAKLVNLSCKTCYANCITHIDFKPIFKKTLLKSDRKLAHSITGIDCSWNLAVPAFKNHFIAYQESFHHYWQENPMNYSKLNKLSTVEALAAAVYIMGDSELMHTLLKNQMGTYIFCTE